MNLEKLFQGVAYTTTLPPVMPVSGVTADSRKVEDGSLFVCITGFTSDGHDYAAQALEQGAAALLVERDLGLARQILVSDSRKAYALVCANWFYRPADHLRLIGVTGTNGKTSTSYILKHLLEQNGNKVGLIGTIQILIGAEAYDTNFTTPDAYEFHAHLKMMLDQACDTVIMEVSSHALALDRVYGVHFLVGGFTNLSQDHLDFHKDMESYFAAKRMLFDLSEIGVTNLDDEYGKRALEGKTCRKMSFAVENPAADYLAKNIRNRPDGVDFELLAPDNIGRVKLPIPGHFSVYNALCAAVCAAAAGVPFQTIVEGLSTVAGVKGRLEVVPTGRDFTAIIDYAHTPDGLEKALQAMRPTCRGRLVTVVGCGGDRDKAKRPLMGGIAARLSDFVIVTSDNPRTENPGAIIQDILAGMGETKTPYLVIENREEAITHAILTAQPDDVILFAGKGHETYQILGKTKIHFDEREKIQDALHRLSERDKMAIRPMTIKDIAKAVGGKSSSAKECMAITTDSRLVPPDSLFIALVGEAFDGHQFIRDAFAQGAVAALSSRPIEDAGGTVIQVADTGKALLDLAAYYRAQFELPVIGLTGSVGKTTTKEMIACVLSARYHTLKTEGNLNNEIGLPRMIFRINEETGCAVLEMGMNHFGEIARLSRTARPTMGVITNIGVSHMENLGSQQGILKAKLELLDGMAENAPLILNGDDKLLYEASAQQRRPVFLYGIDNPECVCVAKDIKPAGHDTAFVIAYQGARYPVLLPAAGRHNVYNALCAFLVGVLQGVTPEEATRALRQYKPAGMRQRINHCNGITLIEDCYNASPDSMKAALSVLAEWPAEGKRIAVLGDMLELGGYAEQGHRECGRAVVDAGIDRLYAFGDKARYYVQEALAGGVEAALFTDKEALAKTLAREVESGDAVLFKASRGMKLEEAMEIFTGRIV